MLDERCRFGIKKELKIVKNSNVKF